MKIKATGLNAIEKKLKQISANAEKLHGKLEVPFSELYNQAFMAQHTRVTSFVDFLNLGGFGASQEEFAAIPDDVFDAHVAKNSSFSSWEEMRQAATSEYIKRKLEL